MKLTTSVLKESRTPNRDPEHRNILITATVLTYVFVGEGAPDSSYEERANLIIGPYQTPIKIPKPNSATEKIYFYQTSGSDSYIAMLEVR